MQNRYMDYSLIDSEQTQGVDVQSENLNYIHAKVIKISLNKRNNKICVSLRNQLEQLVILSLKYVINR